MTAIGFKPLLRAVVGSKVFLAQNLSAQHAAAMGKMFRCFSTESELQYYPLCDDFGPMSLISVVRFIEILDDELTASSNLKIAYCVEEGRRSLTNAIFLLGSYMILKQNASADDVDQRFSWVDFSLVEPYRDATFTKSDFDLSLFDCWQGLERSRNKGWLRFPTTTPGLWGAIDIAEYLNYDDPLNGDLHIVVPGRFVAFKGPRDLDGSEYADDRLRGCRMFSPAYYIDIFRALGVTDVVRLNESEYDATEFTQHGIAHHDLEFDDCTAPPRRVVDAFLRVAAAAVARGGLVAVHCRAGLGRTGTLIALAMMRDAAGAGGFTAREAIAWLRIMRPGCVIGTQQHFLCAVDAGAMDDIAPPAADEVDSAAAAAAMLAGRSTSPAAAAALRNPLSAVAGGKEVADAVPPPPPPAVALEESLPPLGAVGSAAPAPAPEGQPPLGCTGTAGADFGAAAAAAEVAAGMDRRAAARARALLQLETLPTRKPGDPARARALPVGL